MYLFDSGVWVGAFNPKDGHHRKAKAIIEALIGGQLGKALMTDHIFDEVTTYLRMKTRPDRSPEAARAMLDSDHIQMIYVDRDILNSAYHMFKRYEQLSLADAASVVVIRNMGGDGIFSFDHGFDVVRDVNRLETVL